MRLLLLSLALTLTLALDDQQRPTRTLSSLFSSSSKQHPQPPVVDQKQAPRPLVYQVKYYDRGVNTIDNVTPDARHYGTIDKSGVVVDQQSVVNVPQVVVPQQVVPHQPPYPTRYVYYNPLIPPPQDYVYHPTYYTVAQVGNSQVLIPCTQDNYVDSTVVALNVDHPVVQQQPVVTQQGKVVKDQVVQNQPVVHHHSHQHHQQQRVVVPPATVQQPLVREQVVAAAAELNALGSVPGSGVVGAGINSVPYGYYYYYYIPPSVPQVPQVGVVDNRPVPQVTPQVSPYGVPQYGVSPYGVIPNNYVYRYNPQVLQQPQNLVPFVFSGVPQNVGHVTNVVPQPHNVVGVPPRTVVDQVMKPQGTTNVGVVQPPRVVKET